MDEERLKPAVVTLCRTFRANGKTTTKDISLYSPEQQHQDVTPSAIVEPGASDTPKWKAITKGSQKPEITAATSFITKARCTTTEQQVYQFERDTYMSANVVGMGRIQVTLVQEFADGLLHLNQCKQVTHALQDDLHGTLLIRRACERQGDRRWERIRLVGKEHSLHTSKNKGKRKPSKK